MKKGQVCRDKWFFIEKMMRHILHAWQQIWKELKYNNSSTLLFCMRLHFSPRAYIFNTKLLIKWSHHVIFRNIWDPHYFIYEDGIEREDHRENLLEENSFPRLASIIIFYQTHKYHLSQINHLERSMTN